MVWRLLRRNISPGQLAGYAIANLVGLAIVLTAIQFYRDVNNALDEEESFISQDYLIVSKKVEGLSSAGSATEFSQAEIEELKRQPWVKEVGPFTAAAFNVSASIEMGGRGMNSFLFLESIPDDFFDVRPPGWNYEIGTSEPVPIILSKDYLALYNFGFASSRGMPQISEAVIGAVPLRLSLSGRGKQVWLPARIVGFSSRLNTIAVPENFLSWANGEFADQPVSQPSRLIVSTDRPGTPEAKEYFGQRGIEIAGDRLDTGKAAFFLTILTTVVIAIGAIISLLALFILLLSIYLLLQKNREKIHDLMQLGYSPSTVSRYYFMIVGATNVVVLIASIIILIVGSNSWTIPMRSIGGSPSSLIPTIGIGLIIIIAITAVNFLAINRKVSSSFRN